MRLNGNRSYKNTISRLGDRSLSNASIHPSSRLTFLLSIYPSSQHKPLSRLQIQPIISLSSLSLSLCKISPIVIWSICLSVCLLHPTPSHPLSLPLSRTACPYFCSFVISPSPCLTTSAYCLFLSSGLFVSMILLTRSMVQGMRSAAMNFARSLRKEMMGVSFSRV